MKNRFVLGAFASVLSLFGAIGCGPPAAASTPEGAAELEPQTTTVFGERVLLFMEYPHLVSGEPARFLAHLSVLADGEPVRSGHVVLKVGATSIGVDEPRRDGLFTPEGSFPAAGTFPARLVIESDQVTETLDLGDFSVHSSAAEARAAAQAGATEEPPAAVPYLMEQQWKVKTLLAEARPQRLAQRLIVPAQAVLAEGASAVVSPPVQGRLVQPADGALPRTGDRVEEGRILALVEPPLTSPELAQLRALEWDFDRQALGIEQGWAEAEARLHFAEVEQARIGQLRTTGLSTQQQLDEADRELAIARSRKDAARSAKDALERLQPGRADKGNARAGQLLQFPIRAPIGGVVTEVGHVVGESVEPTDRLFRIVDTSRLWIEGRVSEFDIGLVGAAPQPSVRFRALPESRFDLGGDNGGRLLHVAPEVEAASRTFIIRFELPNSDGTIRAGMLAELELAVATVDAAVAIPFDAVVMDQGQPVAYVMLEGELFQKRELLLGVRDGDFVEVRSGVQPGERVASRGASAIRLAALSPASFGAGHQH